MQNKLYFIAVAAVIIGGLVVAWFYIKNTNETVPIMAPLVEISSNATPIPADVINDATRASVKSQYMSPRPYFFPNEYDQGADEDTTLIPAGYEHLLSIPFHTNQSVIRVYANVSCSVALNINADCLGNDIAMVKYDPATKTSDKIGTIIADAAANYGGIYVPLAITPDDKNIILRAWMGSPGAGGGQVDLGYSEITTAPNAAAYTSDKLPRLASALAIFYDSFGKIVSLEENNRTYDWSQPGRSPNQGAIIYRNLITGETKMLADGPDSTYEIRNFDENTRTLGIQQIHYAFGPDCPRTDKILDCAAQSALNSTIRIP